MLSVEDGAVPLRRARLLMIMMVVALMASPPVTILLQVLLTLLVLGSAPLRLRVVRACRQPLVAGALAFYALLTLGTLYSVASPQEAGAMWMGWRKLLVLPLAVAFFDEVEAKLALVLTVIAAACFAALLSFGAAWANIRLPFASGDMGIVIRNHATQGMVFALAAFACASLALYRTDLQPARRWALVACTGLLVANVVFITPGRSGYLTAFICLAVWSVAWAATRRAGKGWALLLGLGIAGALIAALALSPVSHKRIKQAVDELQTYSQASQVTSMGIRVYYWKNALAMVAERPWLGVGTGAFETAYKREVDGRPGIAGSPTSDPHNQFLKIAAEHGLLGLAVFLAFLACAFAQRPTALYRVLGLGVLAAWCGTSQFSSHFSTFSEGTFIFVWLGAMLANETTANSAPPKAG